MPLQSKCQAFEEKLPSHDGSRGRRKEFWLLFLAYIRKLVSSKQIQKLQETVLPLLDDHDFLSKCEVTVFLSILRSLEPSLGGGRQSAVKEHENNATMSLAWSFRVRLAEAAIVRAFAAAVDEDISACIRMAQRILNYHLPSLISIVSEGAEKATMEEDRGKGVLLSSSHPHSMGRVACRLCFVAQQLCLVIRQGDLILKLGEKKDKREGQTEVEVVLSKPFHWSSNGSWLAQLLFPILQSRSFTERVYGLKLAASLVFQSFTAFIRLLPMLEAALYLEDHAIREFVHAVLMDSVYVHHHCLKFSAIRHLCIPFLHAPTTGLQISAILGCSRLLLNDCFLDDREVLLGAMLERYICRPASLKPMDMKTRFDDCTDSQSSCSCSSLNSSVSGRSGGRDISGMFACHCEKKDSESSVLDREDVVNNEQVVRIMHMFFKQFSEVKSLLDGELANTIVFMVLQRIESGVVEIIQGGCGRQLIVRDNPCRRNEAKSLQLAIRFALTICGDALEAVLDSLVLNVASQYKEAVDICKEDWLHWLSSTRHDSS
ncbi:hypothetical protein CBR_g26108 [Chara braunii]|uniref:Uncharacterized protein n=1 Tax=Chara braunii TaxID=69332 RepID=A0A388JVZ0_CHABU|nr:hypothetical protein CBR_g26108 [Chara braunii]|eukprot:GBG61945.1 hypothetical protein CBR_g26108 [Chara braunii]